MTSLARLTFDLLVNLHPREFRTEFGDEMLWIFDETMASVTQKGARATCCIHLLIDGLRSAFIQRTIRARPQSQSGGLHFAQVHATAVVTQIAQGGFLVLSCLFCIFTIVLFLKMVLFRL